jgi:hypothetical protein
MKTSYISQLLCLAASAWNWNLAHALPAHDWQLAEFEERFIGGLDYQLSNKSIKLVGYKKIQIPATDLRQFEDQYFTHHAEWKMDSAYYDQPSATLRIYFPVEAALVEHGGKLVEANHLGELDLEEVKGDCAVLGRKQTDHVTGVEGNIIKDGIIYLADRNQPQHRIGNVHVYDFGDKVIHDHDHDHHLAKRDGKRSCMNNHGGPNCSDKFNIHQGRCPRRSDLCVDYNGYTTNCRKGGWNKYIKVIGSDCGVALSRGHCWNELM